MPGKSPTPDEIAQAVTLRAAGYTLTAISERTGISLRTLSRVFERHGTTKGAVTDELILAAKRDLVEAVTSNDRIREEAARIVADDLAHARQLRARIANASEYLTATNLEEAALLMRAAAAYSTAIKNTSDMLRHSLRTERALDAEDAVDLPELVIREVTDDEALRIRQEHSVPDDGDGHVAKAQVQVETPSEHLDDPNERIEEGEESEQ